MANISEFKGIFLALTLTIGLYKITHERLEGFS